MKKAREHILRFHSSSNMPEIIENNRNMAGEVENENFVCWSNSTSSGKIVMQGPPEREKHAEERGPLFSQKGAYADMPPPNYNSVKASQMTSAAPVVPNTQDRSIPEENLTETASASVGPVAHQQAAVSQRSASDASSIRSNVGGSSGIQEAEFSTKNCCLLM